MPTPRQPRPQRSAAAPAAPAAPAEPAAQAQGAAPDGSGIERRRSTREPVVTLGLIRPLTHDDAPTEQVLVTNVSLHGVGLRSTHDLPVGSRFGIEIGVGPLHLTSRLRVVRSVPRNDGTYDIGGEFC
jgi:hypothetical protein